MYNTLNNKNLKNTQQKYITEALSNQMKKNSGHQLSLFPLLLLGNCMGKLFMKIGTETMYELNNEKFSSTKLIIISPECFTCLGCDQPKVPNPRISSSLLN